MNASILTITLQYANIRKKNYFSELKTFVEINFAGTRYNSAIGKGSNPVWDQVFSLQKTTEPFILVSLHEKGLFFDSLLGEGILLLDFSQVFTESLQQVPLFRYDVKIADIFIKLYIDIPLSRPQTKLFKKKSIRDSLPEPDALQKSNSEPIVQKRKEIDLAIYGVQLSDLRFEKMIYSSQSGNQEVHLGTILTTNTPVAIKVAYCENNEEFNKVQREAMAISQLSHPHICKVYATLLDMSHNKLKNLIILEHCEGVSLRIEIESRAKNSNFFTQAEIWKFMQDLISAFAHIESKHIVHSDVKPDNIVILKNGELKVIDFGISLHGHSELFETTKTLKVGGTVPYFSPLQMQGYLSYIQGVNVNCMVRHHPVKSDVYALGLTFIHMTSLVPPNGLNSLDNGLQGRIINAIASLKYDNKVKKIIEEMLIIEEELRPNFLDLDIQIKSL